MAPEEADGAVERSLVLDGARVEVDGREIALGTSIVGTIDFEFRKSVVSLTGTVSDGAALEVIAFSDGVGVAWGPVEGGGDGRAFGFEARLNALRPVDTEVVVVCVGDRVASRLGPEGSLFPNLPLRDRATYWSDEYYRLVGLAYTRVQDQLQLSYITRWALKRMDLGSPNLGASICVLGYRIVELPEQLLPVAAEVHEATARWNAHLQHPPTGHVARWHVSVNCVAGYVALAQHDFESAEAYFDTVAAFYGDIFRTPISAHNITISTFLAGWLRYKRGETEAALEYFRRTLVVISAGMQVQPIETNYYVWNECMRMSRLGQQAMLLIGQLDPDFGANAMLPADAEFDMLPVLVRVPKLMETLPEGWTKL